MALTSIQGYLLAISVALPFGDGTEDCSLRSILSGEFESISSYARLFRDTGVLGADPLDSVQRIISEAIREGLDPAALGRRKLDVFRSGCGALESKSESGVWAGLRRFVRRN